MNSEELNMLVFMLYIHHHNVVESSFFLEERGKNEIFYVNVKLKEVEGYLVSLFGCQSLKFKIGKSFSLKFLNQKNNAGLNFFCSNFATFLS